MDWQEQPVDFDLAMKNTEQNGSLRFSLNALDFPLQKILWKNHETGEAIFEGKANIALMIESSGQTPLELAKGMAGTLKLDMSKGKLVNLNNNLLQDILPIVDEDDFEIDLNTVTETTNNLLFKKPYQFQMEPIEFAIAGGVARTNNIHIYDSSSNLKGVAKFDLVKNHLLASATLALDEGDERIDGASPDIEFSLTGAINQPDLKVDASPLNNYLALRAFEQQRHRIEALQADILEKQRLNRAVMKIVTKAEIRRETERKKQEALSLEQERLKLEEQSDIETNQIDTPKNREVDSVGIRQRKLKELQLKHDNEIRNRDGITMDELEQDGGFNKTPSLESETQKLLDQILNY
jgi:hypothetical protein